MSGGGKEVSKLWIYSKGEPSGSRLRGQGSGDQGQGTGKKYKFEYHQHTKMVFKWHQKLLRLEEPWVLQHLKVEKIILTTKQGQPELKISRAQKTFRAVKRLIKLINL